MPRLITKRGKPVVEIYFYEVVTILLLVFGLIALVSSVFLDSYLYAFIGLGLTFWGVLFLYLRPTKYVKLELLNASASSSLVNMERALASRSGEVRGVYLPPRLLQDPTSSLVFVPAKQGQRLPTLKEVSSSGLQSRNRRGLLVSPPGLALSKLFEKELHKSFNETDFERLRKVLPGLFERLQITKDMTLEAKSETVMVEIGNHVFGDLCVETRKLPKTHLAIGCPLSSALACTLAKALGKPLIIEKETTSTDGSTTIEYKVLED